MKKIINLITQSEDNNLRVDVFVNKKESTLSRTRIKNLILKEKLKLNGKVINSPSHKVLKGDKINLEIPEPKKTSLKSFDFKLNIIYEDSDLLIINKPAGIIMHPGAGNYDNTIVNALMHYCKGNLSNIGDELRPGIVHRIDKDTSGLVVIAKNNETHEDLSKQFNKHTINRIYQLMIWGKLRPQSGKIETLITRSSKNRQLMEVGISKGKMAITNYNTLEIFENDKTPTFSFIECLLETGRTHQIRVHLSYLGFPIVGDNTYGGRRKYVKGTSENLRSKINQFKRQALHASSLTFIHPSTKEVLTFDSELPDDMKQLIRALKEDD